MQKIGRTVRRRRRESRTDYRARLAFLKSGKPRIVVRKTNKYLIAQIVISEIAQDKTIMSVNSRDLLSMGWPKELKGSLKNISACYLTGYILGKKSKDIGEAILDIGLQRNIRKSRIYAFLKGMIDSGAKISYNEEALPDEKKILSNEKTGKLVEKIKGELN